MANKMLVDAAHPEETRVVVLRGNRVEEFDFESAQRKQLRGNIYLAKVTRVEPSLQAAFVDYGGNRHGFLAFSEIHPDYYQIPVADRQALIEAEQREIEEAESASNERDGRTALAEAADAPEVAGPVEDGAAEPGDRQEAEAIRDEDDAGPGAAAAGSAEEPSAASSGAGGETEDGAEAADAIEVDSDQQVDMVGSEDAMEEVPERRKSRPRPYKIQEVIKRRQVLLVQVVKEERGNKGAALTTYLSLAGRYSVLMPNTARGGGISRKITSPADRKRMKEVVADLDVPEGMGVILRTAGASRTKAEVKRDFEYLLRLWESVRELTLRSIAPTLVYEEGSLIKRAIRDLYNKDIDEILVAGEDAYREAKDFMRMLMPSHAKNVKPYREKQPIFARAGIEAQLDAMFLPQVNLRSGGYLVINQTEALVSIDVNSGRSTREHNIEDTALQTNLEAAEEIARQLRLRDLAGLIVIDFIDMEEKRNNRSVERRLKDALKHDRARIQVGRISHFGLLEMSRQRIRTGVLESTTSVCPTCQGTGHVRAPASVALHVLRSIEDALLKSATHNLIVRTRTPVALYILNQKRPHLVDLEQRFGVSLAVLADEAIVNGAHFAVERGEPATERTQEATAIVQPDSVQPEDEEEEAIEPVAAAPEEEEEHGGRKRRRRRRRRGGEAGEAPRPELRAAEDEAPEQPDAGDGDEEPAPPGTEARSATQEDGDEQPRKRRRGRRGGRHARRGRNEEDEGRIQAGGQQDDEVREDGDAPAGMPSGNGVDDGSGLTEHVPSTPRPDDLDDRILKAIDMEFAKLANGAQESPTSAAAQDAGFAAEPTDEAAAEEAPTAGPGGEEPAEGDAPPAAPEPRGAEPEAGRPKRTGWWQRRSFF